MFNRPGVARDVLQHYGVASLIADPPPVSFTTMQSRWPTKTEIDVLTGTPYLPGPAKLP